jgi:hypothetical protein
MCGRAKIHVKIYRKYREKTEKTHNGKEICDVKGGRRVEGSLKFLDPGQMENLGWKSARLRVECARPFPP